jgi:methylmalonyl-CoA mutase
MRMMKITTPTEICASCDGIQLIINKSGSKKRKSNSDFIIEELTDLVEAVLLEFDRITERGGVLGAMETMYQRSKFKKKVCIMKR